MKRPGASALSFLDARRVRCAALGIVMALAGCSCEDMSDNSQTIEQRFAHLEKVDIPAKDTVIRAWIARSGNDVQRGLMFVTADDMAPYADGAQRGMFFYFDRQRSAYEGFWMRNVPIPLDIAFLGEDGRVITVETMAPFDERSTRPDSGYRFALEVRGGLFKELGLRKGDTIAIPDAILNSSP